MKRGLITCFLALFSQIVFGQYITNSLTTHEDSNGNLINTPAVGQTIWELDPSTFDHINIYVSNGNTYQLEDSIDITLPNEPNFRGSVSTPSIRLKDDYLVFLQQTQGDNPNSSDYRQLIETRLVGYKRNDSGSWQQAFVESLQWKEEFSSHTIEFSGKHIAVESLAQNGETKCVLVFTINNDDSVSNQSFCDADYFFTLGESNTFGISDQFLAIRSLVDPVHDFEVVILCEARQDCSNLTPREFGVKTYFWNGNRWQTSHQIIAPYYPKNLKVSFKQDHLTLNQNIFSISQDSYSWISQIGPETSTVDYQIMYATYEIKDDLIFKLDWKRKNTVYVFEKVGNNDIEKRNEFTFELQSIDTYTCQPTNIVNVYDNKIYVGCRAFVTEGFYVIDLDEYTIDQTTQYNTITSLEGAFDTDRDGLPNEYENNNALDSSNPNDTTTDIDGDGLSAIEEFRYGTNPQVNDTPPTKGSFIKFPSYSFKSDSLNNSVFSADLAALSNDELVIFEQGNCNNSNNNNNNNTTTTQLGCFVVYKKRAQAWERTQVLSAEYHSVIAGSMTHWENTIAIIGYDNNVGASASNLYIFEKNNEGLWFFAQKVPLEGRHWYNSVANAAHIDGETILVSGSVNFWLYTKSSEGIWTYKDKKALTEIDDIRYRVSGSDSAKGNTLLVGVPRPYYLLRHFFHDVSEGPGSVLAYEKDLLGNWTYSQTLIPNNSQTGDLFGRSISHWQNSAIISGSYFKKFGNGLWSHLFDLPNRGTTKHNERYAIQFSDDIFYIYEQSDAGFQLIDSFIFSDHAVPSLANLKFVDITEHTLLVKADGYFYLYEFDQDEDKLFDASEIKIGSSLVTQDTDGDRVSDYCDYEPLNSAAFKDESGGLSYLASICNDVWESAESQTGDETHNDGSGNGGSGNGDSPDGENNSQDNARQQNAETRDSGGGGGSLGWYICMLLLVLTTSKITHFNHRVKYVD